MKRISKAFGKALDFGKKAVRLTHSVGQHLLGGAKRVSEEKFKERLAICHSCEFLDAKAMRCQNQGCGCFLNLKAWMEDQRCPIKKW